MGSPSIAIVGCGKMGEAILKGWLSVDEGAAAALNVDSFTIVSPEDDVRARQVDDYGVRAVTSVGELAIAASDTGKPFDMVVLAVKPQVMPSVLEEVAALATSGTIADDALYVSIAAGIPTSAYEQALGADSVHVVRVMPNMPLQVGMGASVVTGGAHATDEEVAEVNALFDALGQSHIVPEDQIDAVCAISGGGPAYFAYMVEALGDAGAELGLDRDLAESLALATMGGTFHAIVESGVAPAQMRESVCSPGGTTLAALASMDDDGFTPSMAKAMQAAVDRAAELRGDR